MSSENTKRTERAVRNAAARKFGRRRNHVVYEHGEWRVHMTAFAGGEAVFKAAIGNDSIDFERV